MGTLGGSVANNDPAACYPARCWRSGATIGHRRSARSRPTTSSRACSPPRWNEGELITAIRFPVPKRAPTRSSRQKASHFPLVGVFVAQYDAGVRVAITGAGNGVFRHAGWKTR